MSNAVSATARFARSERSPLRKVRPAWVGVLGLGALTLFFTASQSAFNVYVFDSCLLACIGAIALNVLMGTAGQVSVGNAAFLAVGGFVSVWMLRSGVPFPLDIILAALFAAAVGLMVGTPALRLHGLELALATLAAHFIVIHFANQYQLRSGGSSGFTITPLFNSRGLVGSGRDWAWLLWCIVAVVVLGASRLMRERSGRALRMIRDHEVAAPALGIEVTRYKLLIFAVTSGVIGLEGGLLAHFTGSVTTDNYSLTLAIQYVAMILIGGLDSIAGAVVGAGIVTALPTLTPRLVAGVLGTTTAARYGSQIAEILYGGLIILFIVSSSGGLVGWARQLKHGRLFRLARSWFISTRRYQADEALVVNPVDVDE